MKKICRTMLLIFSLTFAGCANTATAVATSVPSAVSAPTNSFAPGTVAASATAVPIATSNMAFVISAPVKEVKVKEGEQVKAGQVLAVLDTPSLNFSVVEAQAALQAAQSDAILQRYRRKEYINGRFIYLSGPPERIKVADAKAVQAQAALDAARAELVQGTLVTPYDGTIVAINVVAGEFVQPGQVAIVLADLSRMQIETTDLSERDIAGVQIGQTATVQIKALNQDFTGRVVAIAPMAVKHNADWVYRVTIELDNLTTNLLWGMSADVEIKTSQ